MDKLEGKLLEDYLRIVVDIQKQYTLIAVLQENLFLERDDYQTELFMRSAASGGSIVRGALYFLAFILMLFHFALIVGGNAFIGWVLIGFLREGGLDTRIGTLLCILLGVVWMIGWTGMWVYCCWFEIHYARKLRKAGHSLKSESEEKDLNIILQTKAIFLTPEIENLSDLNQEWKYFLRDWNSRSYSVIKKRFQPARPRWALELERSVIMYESILFGQCKRIEGKDGAFAFMKSVVGRKGINQKDDLELLRFPEEVREKHPILFEVLVDINEKMNSIQESNNAILNEFLSTYKTQSPKESIIKPLYEKTECKAYILECKKKKKEYINWRLELNDGKYKDYSTRWYLNDPREKKKNRKERKTSK